MVCDKALFRFTLLLDTRAGLLLQVLNANNVLGRQKQRLTLLNALEEWQRLRVRSFDERDMKGLREYRLVRFHKRHKDNVWNGQQDYEWLQKYDRAEDAALGVSPARPPPAPAQKEEDEEDDDPFAWAKADSADEEEEDDDDDPFAWAKADIDEEGEGTGECETRVYMGT